MSVSRQILTLTQHRLAALPQLSIDPNLFEKSFSVGCSIANCSAECCRYGVMIDLTERENILAYDSIIQQHMDPHQEKDPAKWFDDWEDEDSDFPSGKCTGTRMKEYGCVFLNRVGQCVLQKAAVAEGLPKFALKPFFCVAYPVTIESGTLTLEKPNFTDQTQCCARVKNGAQTAIEVCSEELAFALGDEGFAKLKSLAPVYREVAAIE